MKAEINAAAEFLSRIFLAHENVNKEKVTGFKQHLEKFLEERFRDHWHESCPTKGQAYRCIRICPEEPLDPIIEKVCNDVGVNCDDFNLPFELTLWVDPTEVVCKFGDLKCSYHTVAKKDKTSGNLDNQSASLDIDDIVENARDLYQKKQTVVIHPINSSEMHLVNPYPDGTPNNFTVAIRMNGTMHYNLPVSGSPPTGYLDGSSPRGKGGKPPPHSANHHKRGGYHYYGKGSGGKGSFLSNGSGGSGPNGTHPHLGMYGPQNHRSHNGHHHHGGHQHQHAQHHQAHHSHNGNGHQQANHLSSPYNNSYLNGYGTEESSYSGYDQRSVSPSKMNGLMSGASGHRQISQSSPTPEQIQQQVQHPPPMPPPPHHLQAFNHPDTSTLPPPPTQHTSQPPPPPQASTPSSISPPSSLSTSNNSTNSVVNGGVNSSGVGPSTKSSNAGSSGKYQVHRGNNGRKQSSPNKEIK